MILGGGVTDMHQLRYSLPQVVFGNHCWWPRSLPLLPASRSTYSVSPGSPSLLAFCHHPQILQRLKTSQQFPPATQAYAGSIKLPSVHLPGLTQPLLARCLLAGCYSKLEIHLSKSGYCNYLPRFCPGRGQGASTLLSTH